MHLAFGAICAENCLFRYRFYCISEFNASIKSMASSRPTFIGEVPHAHGVFHGTSMHRFFFPQSLLLVVVRSSCNSAYTHTYSLPTARSSSDFHEMGNQEQKENTRKGLQFLLIYLTEAITTHSSKRFGCQFHSSSAHTKCERNQHKSTILDARTRRRTHETQTRKIKNKYETKHSTTDTNLI